jgi:ferredoxin-NADP reductase
MTPATLALIIIAVILVQVTIAMLFGFYRRKSEYKELDQCKNTPQTVSTLTPSISADEMLNSNLAWEGFREFFVQRREFEDTNHSICSFYLVPVDGQPLPVFRPGQFLTFKLLIEDHISQRLKTVVRCYSLSDSPKSDYYRVSIKRVPAPNEHPEMAPGLSSNFFHEHVHENSPVLLKAPSGHFYLQEDVHLPIVLIGGGIGITPMLSILNTVLESGINREVWLYYGLRNGDEHIMKEHLQALARTYDNFHLHVCYSSPNEKDIEGIDYQHRGRVSISLLRNTLKLMHYQFYVCGPKPLMESMVPGLQEWGVDSSDIYYESFGPATLIKHKKVVDKTDNIKAMNITFRQSGKTILWDTAADSLLDFAEANNIEVESGCRAGSCGSCQTAVESGEVNYNQSADADVTPGHCLLCISTPKSDLILDI